MVIVFALISLELVYLCRLALTPEVTVGIYWIYLCLYWIQCITSVVLAILIATNKNEDGPTFLVKVRIYENFVSDKFKSLPNQWRIISTFPIACMLRKRLSESWAEVKRGFSEGGEGRGQKGETV